MSHPANTHVRIPPLFIGAGRAGGLRFFSAVAVTVWSIGVLIPGFAENPAKTTTSSQALSVRSRVEVENIATLIQALRRYAGRSNGEYPATMVELVQKGVLTADEFSRLNRSPLDLSGLPGDGYLYYLEGKSIKSAPTEVLILGRNPLTPSDPRRAVGMQDGSVVWWKRPQVEAFLKAARKPK